MALYPTFASPEIKGFKTEVNAEYKGGLYFDFMTGDIRIDGSGKIVRADEKNAWLQWCEKSILTQFNAFLAYSSAYGADMQYVMDQTTKQAREDAIKSEIRIALQNDPARRTLEINDFAFEWDVDSVKVTFTVYGADGYTGNISVELGG